jgi:hypothetical protein
MLRRVALVRADVSEELSASFVRVTRIGKLGTTLAVTTNSETSVRTRATRRNIPEDAILDSHSRENLKSYMDSSGSEKGVLASACKDGNEPSRSINCMECLEQLNYYKFITL